MEEAQITGLVIAYTQLVKDFLPKKILQLVPVFMGIGLTTLYELSQGTFSPLSTLLKGLVIGAAASGTYKVADGIINKQ